MTKFFIQIFVKSFGGWIILCKFAECCFGDTKAQASGQSDAQYAHSLPLIAYASMK